MKLTRVLLPLAVVPTLCAAAFAQPSPPTQQALPRFGRQIVLPAQASGPGSSAVDRDSSPSIQATRISESEAPTIDGDLSDPAWAKAGVIDRFYQIEPNNGAPPTDRTVVRVMYDKDNLYLGFYAYDSDPENVVATLKQRDGGTYRDDNFRILLDPGRTKRNAYNFEISVLGAYTDALIQNNSDFFQDWNTIWYHAGKPVKDGWVAEMAIPFRSLSYDASSQTWGFDIMRGLQHKNERVRWAYTPASVPNTDLSTEGTITGLQGMDQGLGLDVQLYGLTRYKQEWLKHDGTVAFEGSGNAFYKITPSLTGTVTVNTDFSDAPLDKRQVNTTRFSLFTPETREFFLQDTANFEFAGRAFYNGFRTGFGSAMSNGRPFFSRNIGLVRGVPVTVLAGGKISGEVGGLSVGALTVRTTDSKVAPAQQLSVARVTAPVFAESRIGVIGTNGDPTGATKNSLAGADFQYYDSNFFPGQRASGDFYFMRSFSNTLGKDDEYGASLAYPNEPYSAEAHYKHLGQNFAPVLGFANRLGDDEYRVRVANRDRFRDSFFRWIEEGARAAVVTDLHHQVESSEYAGYLNASSTVGDQLTISVIRSYENIAHTFFLPGHIPVTPGQYEWWHVTSRIDTSFARPFTVFWETDCCEYYDGKYFRSDITLDWRIDPTFSFNFEQVTTVLDMPKGSQNVYIGLLDFQINFTPDMQLRTQVQYDNITKQMSVLARYNWEYEPGQEIFASVGDTSIVDGTLFKPNYHARTTQAILRIGHTFQF